MDTAQAAHPQPPDRSAQRARRRAATPTPPLTAKTLATLPTRDLLRLAGAACAAWAATLALRELVGPLGATFFWLVLGAAAFIAADADAGAEAEATGVGGSDRRVRLAEAPVRLAPSLRPALAPMLGRWAKDYGRSDTLDAACDLWRINFVVRNAMNLVRGLELRVERGGGGEEAEEEQLIVLLPSVVKWFKIREHYSLDGSSETRNRRRDLRRGGARSSVRACPGGAVRITNAWDGSLTGSLVDELSLRGEELVVTSTLTICGQKVVFNTTYTRIEG